MKRSSLILSVLALMLTAGLCQATLIATFADPAFDSTTPLFTVGPNNQVTGGWSDSQTNLDLEYMGNVYNDAFFTMTALTYTGGLTGGTTGGGTIMFFADNADTMVDAPVLQIDFTSAYVNPNGLGGNNIFAFFANGVEFSGAIVGTEAGVAANLDDESFSFSFTHQVLVSGGYTATAAFTSSATPVVPEPATMGLLISGVLALVRRRK